MFGKVIHMRLMMKIKMNSIEDSMKTLALLFSLIPFTLHANLDGVYKNTYQKNGYFCEFNADIKQAANSITELIIGIGGAFLDIRDSLQKLASTPTNIEIS